VSGRVDEHLGSLFNICYAVCSIGPDASGLLMALPHMK
jgi:hypothetical protein